MRIKMQKREGIKQWQVTQRGRQDTVKVEDQKVGAAKPASAHMVIAVGRAPA